MTTVQATIVADCQTHWQNNWRKDDYRAALRVGTDFFVKFDDPKVLLPEFAMQKYIFEYAQNHPKEGIPRIPKPLFYFIDGITLYLVMEYIELEDLPLDPQRRAAALGWLSEVPLPAGHVFGPLEGGRIYHSFFKDWEAPLNFSSVAALERYIEKGRTRLPLSSQPQCPPVCITGERIIFMQADINPGNFGVDKHGQTVMMDFAMIAPLPLSFAAYTMGSNPDFASIVESLGLSSNPNIASMAKISYTLWMTANPTLSLNNDGFSTSSKK